MLKKLANKAGAVVNDLHHTIVGDTGREIVHKLNNAVGTDRPLYRKPKKFTRTEHDVRRAVALKNRTAEELVLADAWASNITEAVKNRAETDVIISNVIGSIEASHAYREGIELQNQLRSVQQQSRLQAEKRKIAGILEADRHAEAMATAHAWKTVDTSAHTQYGE